MPATHPTVPRLALAGWAVCVVAVRAAAQDWTRFGWDAGRSSAPGVPTGITAANVASLERQQVAIDGTVDASAIYLHGARVQGRTVDVFFVTTTYGKTLAIDAAGGTVLWEYTPPDYNTWVRSYRVTTATPVADPDRAFVYAASPDGKVQKLAVADGHAVWSTAITRLPRREKLASPLNYFAGHVIASTGGYVGDASPYQGHVAVLDGAIRLLDWGAMRGTVPHRGGERQVVATPSGAGLFSAPAVLRSAAATWLFAADDGGTAAWTLVDGQLRPMWRAGDAGTSPVVAGGLLFVYDPGGGVRGYDAPTGRRIGKVECGRGHGNSATVVDGRIALPEGNSNDHATSGILDIWRLR